MYKVLLVDDEPAIIEAEKRTINSRIANYSVVGEAYSVTQAINLIQDVKPDVVLTDMKMPRHSGIDLIKHVSKLEDSIIVTVAVSGYSDFQYVHDAFSYGAYDYLLKPVDPEKMIDLFSKISETLKTATSTDRRQELPQAKMSGAELVKKIDIYIKNHLSDDNSIFQMCSRFTISQPYLSKIFKKYKDCTYNDHLTSIKIEKAKEMLKAKEDYLIGDIAMAVGFSDQFYFSKVFKNQTGFTPREYKGKN